MSGSDAPALACAALEVALNRYLGLEPDALAQCAALAGRSIQVTVDPLGWSFHLEFHAGGVRIAPAGGQAADVKIAGGATPLLRMAWIAAQGKEALPRDLRIEGDTELLDRFSRLLRQVGFDPEEQVARVVGDGAALRVTEAVRGLLGWTRQAAATLSLDTAEYLREETGDLVHRADAETWMDQVDALRSRLDRFEARLRRLEARRGAPA